MSEIETANQRIAALEAELAAMRAGGEPALFVSALQFEALQDQDGMFGTYLPARKTLAGKFDKPLYTHQPAAQDAELPDAARDVLAERQRQISVEGWTQWDDDNEQGSGHLSSAAACYALNASTWLRHPGASRTNYAALSPINWTNWPWAEQWWKPKAPRRDLVKAGALILAEIERIDRAAIAAQGDKS